MRPLTIGSLFAGIGGFDLGLERAGMRSVWQSEIDPYCLRVLEKHWPDVLRVRDIRDVGTGTVPRVDVVAGGFPCQDLSYAGKGEGIDGERSGLWSEYARVIRELRPRYVIVENVPALLARGFERVLGDLAALGYDAEWDCIPASAVGAPHQRDRIWIVAYPDDGGERERPRSSRRLGKPEPSERQGLGRDGEEWSLAAVAYANGERPHRPRARNARRDEPSDSRGGGGVRADDSAGGWWAIEPDVPRVADGVPHRVDRLRSLGNALVPQIAEWIGVRIMEYERG